MIEISRSLADAVLLYRDADFPDFGGFLSWLFATALAGRMARKGIHFAETTTAPRDVVFSDKDPETRDEKSLIFIPRRSDILHVVDGIFLQWPVWEAVSIRHGFRGADWCG